MRRRSNDFLRDRSGSSAVEFAILGSVFFTLLLGQFEVGFLMFLQHRLDNATTEASRAVQLGAAQRGGDDTSGKFRDHRLCPALGPYLDCSQVVVDTAVLPDGSAFFDGGTWAATPVGSRSGDAFCVGSSGEFMILRVSYPQPPLLGALLPEGMFTSYRGETVTMLQSFAALRVEPVEARRTGACK